MARRSPRSHLVKPLVFVLAAAMLVMVAACGESKESKAKKQVCSARSDIETQVKKLQGLTLTTATTSGVKDSLTSIRSDLQKIKDAQPDLNAARKQQVKSANDAFVSEFKSIASDLGTGLSISSGKAKLQTALQQLTSAYQSTFAKVDCS
jgi:hypothetical protein